ncbi:AraC family transcriptional regulator [bacterium]|nr:AraC family transcriptional regulator [bacterium]
MHDNEINEHHEEATGAQTLVNLRNRVARWTDRKELVTTAITGMYLFRRDRPSGPETVMYEPCVAILTQGAKRVYPGDDSFVYDSHHFLMASVDIPTIVEVIEASPEQPCLGIVLDIDRREVSQLVANEKLPLPSKGQPQLGISAGAITPELLDAVCRLVCLLDAPQDIPILAPVIRREIMYRLLMSGQGARLRQMVTAGSRSHQISRAIDWLKENFDQPLKVGELAARVGMSPSTFHQHFRSLTARSPLQYQKWLRLNEARRLMLTEHLDACHAALQVGYESPSHFGREYSRLFGNSPRRDIAGLRQEV